MTSTLDISVQLNRGFFFDDADAPKLGKSWPKHEANECARAIVTTLHEALSKRWSHPTYIVAHEPVPCERRLSKDVLTNAAALAELGGAVRMRLAIFDVDQHGMRPDEVDGWFDGNERRKVAALLAAYPGLVVWRSRGGYRILGVLPAPFEIRDAETDREWRRLTFAWLAHLQRAFGINADPLHDFTRYQRVPHDTRAKGEKPQELEVIGSVEEIGAWSPALTDADWKAADGMLKRPSGKATPKRARSAGATPGRSGGQPSLFRIMLQRRGLLGAFDGEKWPIICPLEHEHSSPRDDFDDDTVLYENESKDWGGIYCMHSNCGHEQKRSAKDWMACFAEQEISEAKRALGLTDRGPVPDRSKQPARPAATPKGDGARTEGETEADKEGQWITRADVQAWVEGQRTKAREHASAAENEKEGRKKKRAESAAKWFDEQAACVEALLAGNEPGSEAWEKAVWRLVEQTGANVESLVKLCGEGSRGQARAARLRRTFARGDHVELGERLVQAIDWGRNVVAHEGQLYRYTPGNGRWTVVDDAAVSCAAQSFSGCWRKAVDEGENAELKIKAGDVAGAITLAMAQTARADFFTKAVQGIAYADGFEKISNDGRTEFVPHSIDHRVRHGLDFAYQESPPAPVTWLAFLRDTWGDDTESMALLHQMLGYLLVQDTSMQKIFLMLGPPRCGKGTIIRLIKEMIGTGFTPFKVNRLDNEFGLTSLLGKSVAADGDVRRSTGRNKDEGAIVERLLGISGEDEQAVGIKFKPDVCCRLGVRLVLASNPPFGLRDPGSTLASRLVILPFFKSHLGSEDTDLFDKLRAELPGIIRLAIDGLVDLRAEGRFIEPASARPYRDQIEKRQNPMAEFISDYCEIGDGLSAETDDVYQAMRWWALNNGHTAPSSNAFGDSLAQLGVTKMRPRVGERRMARRYVGIALKPEAEGFAEKMRERMATLRQSWR